MAAMTVKALVRALLDLQPDGEELVYVRGEAGTRWGVVGAATTGGLGAQVVLTLDAKGEDDDA